MNLSNLTTSLVQNINDDLKILEGRGWTNGRIMVWLGEMRLCLEEIQNLLNKNTLSTYTMDYEISDAIDEIAIFERRYGAPEETYVRREV